MAENKSILSGILIEEESEFSIDDLCRACSVKTETISLLVEEGIIEPLPGEAETWHFSAVSLQRVRTAIRLQNDLGLNIAGAALAIDLLDKITTLRTRLEVLGEEPDE